MSNEHRAEAEYGCNEQKEHHIFTYTQMVSVYINKCNELHEKQTVVGI